MNSGFLHGFDAMPRNFRKWLTGVVLAMFLGASAASAAPTITTPPAGAIICAGTNVVMSVAANGTGALSYQWQLNRTNLAGATGSTLVRNNIQPIQQGHYRVVVSDTTGSVTSTEALVVVLFPPTVVAQTGNTTVDAGQPATFTVLVTAKPPSTYQWRKNSQAITGATNNVYTISSAVGTDAGTYDCLLANSCGTATSSPIQFQVGLPPLVTTDPVDRSVEPGANVTFSVVATGSPTLTYQWCKDGTPLPGQTGTSISLPNVQFVDEGGYSVKVTNPYGMVASRTATLTVSGRPVIIVHPLSHSVLLGDNVTLNVKAKGREPISYQWMKAGVDIPGATSTNLHLSNIQAADITTYSARAFNTEGTAVSSNAVISLSGRVVRVGNTQTFQFTPGDIVPVPVTIDAEGGENRVRFSLAFDATRLTFSSLSNRFNGATANGALADPAGMITVDWQLPTGQALSAGSNQVMFDVHFAIKSTTNQAILFLPPENSPVAKSITGPNGETLAAKYITGTVVFKRTGVYFLSPLTGFTQESFYCVYPSTALGSLPFPQMEVSNPGIDTLNDPIILMNATKTNSAGTAIVVHPGTLFPGNIVTTFLEFDVSDRITAPSPTLNLLEETGVLPSEPVGGTALANDKVRVIRQVVAGGAVAVIDFFSTNGRLYYVQYRENAAATWRSSFPPVRASGPTTRWSDLGSSRTSDQPTATREYRVLEFSNR